MGVLLQSTDFLRPFLETALMAGKFAVGEYFEGSPVLVNQWIFNPTGMNRRPNAFDFPLKFVLNAMCNNAGRFDMAQLDYVGLAGMSPVNAVTFVENHDTDLSPGQHIVFTKMLGYAYILTPEGYPGVYYRDYDMGPDGYPLKPQIDNLIWIHEQPAAGPTQQSWKDFHVFAYERLGGHHLLVGLNDDPRTTHTITVATGFGAHVRIHDSTGHAPDLVTDDSGNVRVTIPRNSDGLGYVCYSVAGVEGVFDLERSPATQEFQGARDLDILPAPAARPVQVGRVWCAAGTPIVARLKPVTDGWTDATSTLLQLMSPNGSELAREVISRQTSAGAELHAAGHAEGFHVCRHTASNAPAANPDPRCSLTVTYSAPMTLTREAAVFRGPTNAADVGQRSAIVPLANAPIHSHVLPTGKGLVLGTAHDSVGRDASVDQTARTLRRARLFAVARPRERGGRITARRGDRATAHVRDGRHAVRINRRIGERRSAMQTRKMRFAPVRVVINTGSSGARLLSKKAGFHQDALTKGLPPSPQEDLIFRGGKTIPNLTYVNFYVAGQTAWNAADIQNIDNALAAAMSDRDLNNVMMQYFNDQPITTTAAKSVQLPGAAPTVFSQGDAEALVLALNSQQALAGFDLTSTVVNLLLPRGTVLTTDEAPTSAIRSLAAASQKGDAAIPHEDEASSQNGLGGFHGSVHPTMSGVAQTIYYAVGVFSETTPTGQVNGIAAFPEPWKNVVATFYHELNEARTDPDVEDAVRTGDDSFLGWTSAHGEEIGDFPIDETNGNLSLVFKEVRLTDGSGTVPIQLMYSNAVHGPEGPIKTQHAHV